MWHILQKSFLFSLFFHFLNKFLNKVDFFEEKFIIFIYLLQEKIN
jgi:hypothetical protein